MLKTIIVNDTEIKDVEEIRIMGNTIIVSKHVKNEDGELIKDDIKQIEKMDVTWVELSNAGFEMMFIAGSNIKITNRIVD